VKRWRKRRRKEKRTENLRALRGIRIVTTESKKGRIAIEAGTVKTKKRTRTKKKKKIDL